MSREWAWRIGGVLVAILASYFAAQGAVAEKIAVVNNRVTAVETTENAHFAEIIRRLDEMQSNNVETRSEFRGDLRTLREQILQLAKDVKD